MKDKIMSTGNLKVVFPLPIFQPPSIISLALHPLVRIPPQGSKHYILCDIHPHFSLKIIHLIIEHAFLLSGSLWPVWYSARIAVRLGLILPLTCCRTLKSYLSLSFSHM